MSDSDSEFEAALLGEGDEEEEEPSDDPDYDVESEETASSDDEKRAARSKIKRADPVKIWTVSSSHIVPVGATGSGQVKRGHQGSVANSKRQKQENANTSCSSAVEQENEDYEEDDDYEDYEEEENSNKEEENLTCKLCSETFQSKMVLDAHQCKDAIYYCKICYMQSTRPRQYALMPLSEAERHFYIHFHQGYLGNKDSTRTDRISFKFQVPEELRGKTSFITCDDDLVQLKDLYIGTFQTEDDDKPHSCGLCGVRFSLPGPRSWHVTKMHLEHKTRKCGVADCAKLSFSTKDKLLRHMFEAHSDLVVKERYWKCNICTMQFQDRTDLEWHFYWHMKPAVKIGAASQKYSQGRPPSHGGSAGGGRPQFRCTICSYETVESTKVPLFTSSEAHDHLAWHWQNERPPELPTTPVLDFSKDSGLIHRLYMIPFASNLAVTCKFCGMNITVDGTYNHLQSYHKHMLTDPHCCMLSRCKHLQFSEKRDFFTHMFSQHVTVVKKNRIFKFLCQICNKTCNNRGEAEWHCYFHKTKGDR
ncbi:zinc finger protein 227-like [Branchiostoma floridae]|uniref:Zinc finger protein 227-like n=1 Tax=Branchiostoma floridae TaxID=7739 RepID=A0A9J7LC90_BRAFL|nr:zinc finger protein 227-like [Branchiostoma floridae]XP_035680052.1 zinc finger protein 227-like [Branchiostoma floridae]